MKGAKGRGSGEDMDSDTSLSEGCQGGSGRPRRGCFFGSTEGSKTHRSRYENGVELSRRMPQHPVTSVAKTTKTSARIDGASEFRVRKNTFLAGNEGDLRLSAAKENRKASYSAERSFTGDASR